MTCQHLEYLSVHPWVNCVITTQPGIHLLAQPCTYYAWPMVIEVNRIFAVAKKDIETRNGSLSFLNHILILNLAPPFRPLGAPLPDWPSLHQGVMPVQLPKKHCVVLCPLSMYPSRHSNLPIMPWSRRGATTIPFCGASGSSVHLAEAGGRQGPLDYSKLAWFSTGWGNYFLLAQFWNVPHVCLTLLGRPKSGIICIASRRYGAISQ